MKKIIIALILLGMHTYGFCSRRRLPSFSLLPTTVSFEEQTRQEEEKRKTDKAQALERLLKELKSLAQKQKLPNDHPAHTARAVITNNHDTISFKTKEGDTERAASPLAYVDYLLRSLYKTIEDSKQTKIKWNNTVEKYDDDGADRSNMYQQSGRNAPQNYSDEEKALFDEMEQEQNVSFNQKWL